MVSLLMKMFSFPPSQQKRQFLLMQVHVSVNTMHGAVHSKANQLRD